VEQNKEVGRRMEAKEVALIIALLGVSLVLNPRLSGLAIPSFFPGLWFYFWEIPILIALFLLGLKYAISIALGNGFVLILFWGPGFNNPLLNLLSALSTVFGVYFARKLLSRKYFQERGISRSKEVIVCTVFTMLLRLAIMTPAVFFYAGFFILYEVIIMLLPFLIIYDITIVAYTVPLAYLIERRVEKDWYKFNRQGDIEGSITSKIS
jgi:hypothetical protein